MRRPRYRGLPRGAILAGMMVGLCVQPAAAETSLYPTAYTYRDIDGQPLPFQDTPTILDALRTATVVSNEPMSRGIAKNKKLVLEYEGVRFRAVLRTIDAREKEKTGSQRMVVTLRDAHIFEAAAFELSEQLGIGRVPPTVVRALGHETGTVQIWMEGVTPEDIMIEEGRLKPPDLDAWSRQKAIMRVFDALIANIDRNQGNLLIDADWNIWFIDHTRAFRETSTLVDANDLEICERKLWNSLQQIDPTTMRNRLEPYLTSKELKKLLLRHDKLIKHFEKRIRKTGESEVLFDLDPPVTSSGS